MSKVKFDEGGNLLPVKRPRHDSNLKEEANNDVRCATPRNFPLRVPQTDIWTPVTPKRFAETPETCFTNNQSAIEDTSSATSATLDLTPNQCDWVQRVEAFVASEAPEMLDFLKVRFCECPVGRKTDFSHLQRAKF